jgi:hypothetical protein
MGAVTDIRNLAIMVAIVSVTVEAVVAMIGGNALRLWLIAPGTLSALRLLL